MEKSYVVIPLLLAVAFLVFFNVAFSGEKEEASKSHESGEVAFKGEEIYQQTCSGCHGQQYEGSVGPALKSLSYSEDELEKILKNGKGTGMPAGLVSGKEKEMAKYLLSLN